MTHKGTLLVVDDTSANLKLLADILSAEGYQVRPADSGELALAAVAANPPELLLLDIRMPGLDGFEVCRRLKAQPESRNIPIIFISAFGENAERVEGLKLGAVDFITKPFHREELLARVQTHLELRRLHVRLEEQAADLQGRNAELAAALANVKSLTGLLPICAGCKKIRDDMGYWSRVETYIEKNSDATFTHGLCPDCLNRLYPDLEESGPGDSVHNATCTTPPHPATPRPDAQGKR